MLIELSTSSFIVEDPEVPAAAFIGSKLLL
jgi:hypothetical protein